MPQVTPNTQIDTINILQEADPKNRGTDYFFIQRGATSHKIKKSDITLPINQLDTIGGKKVIGNLSQTSDVPDEIDLLDSSDSSEFNSDSAIVTEKRIKDYIDGRITDYDTSKDNIYYVNLAGSTFATNPSRSNINNSYTSVINAAKVVYPNLPAGSKVIVNWGYQLSHYSNGTSYRQTSSVIVFVVNAGNVWARTDTFAI